MLFSILLLPFSLLPIHFMYIIQSIYAENCRVIKVWVGVNGVKAIIKRFITRKYLQKLELKVKRLRLLVKKLVLLHDNKVHASCKVRV